MAQTRAATQEASGHISSLGRKAFTNTILLYFVILCLMGGIGYVAYTKIQKKEEPSPAPPAAPALNPVPGIVPPTTEAPVTEAPPTDPTLRL
mgnify:CR=1 FL=1